MEFEKNTMKNIVSGEQSPSPWRILVVDDEPHVVSALFRLLKDSYRVDTATTGERALDCLQRYSYAIVMADQRMPEITGVELLSQALKLQPDSTRILLTGYADIHSLIHAVNDAQIYHYIVKPWNPDDLQLILKGAAERYQMKLQLNHYIEELRRQHEELEHAYDQLQTLDSAKRHFLNIVSHELKTPLTTILAYTDSLLRDSQDVNKYSREEQIQFLQKLQQAAEYLHRLIDDAIDLTAIQTGKFELKRGKEDLLKIVDRAIERLSQSSQKKDITFEKQIDLLRIYGDCGRLTQIFERILEQALCDAPVGAKISITASRREEWPTDLHRAEPGEPTEGPCVLMTLCDARNREWRNALSSSSKAPDPFSPLSPAEESLLHYRSGQGLSLPLCHGLIELLGGKLAITQGAEGSLAYHLVIPIGESGGNLI